MRTTRASSSARFSARISLGRRECGITCGGACSCASVTAISGRWVGSRSRRLGCGERGNAARGGAETEVGRWAGSCRGECGVDTCGGGRGGCCGCCGQQSSWSCCCTIWGKCKLAISTCTDSHPLYKTRKKGLHLLKRGPFRTKDVTTTEIDRTRSPCWCLHHFFVVEKTTKETLLAI